MEESQLYLTRQKKISSKGNSYKKKLTDLLQEPSIKALSNYPELLKKYSDGDVPEKEIISKHTNICYAYKICYDDIVYIIHNDISYTLDGEETQVQISFSGIPEINLDDVIVYNDTALGQFFVDKHNKLYKKIMGYILCVGEIDNDNNICLYSST